MDRALPKNIGPYQILSQLAKGGMGEVFLALDPACDRQVALKRIRADLSENKALQDRFLREARIAAQLMHPSIIPIYVVNQKAGEIYYTMPYVEGETLKQIIRSAAEEEQRGELIHPIGSSIPALMRIFLNICQGIAYSHSRGILHRDLKPENVIVGKFGEVFILDWGLGCWIHTPQQEATGPHLKEIAQDLTRPGKIPGTLAYLAPERVFGEEASIASDIYALGVILYQLLTLKLPFQRHSLQSFRRTVLKEALHNPIEMAPYRDISQHLADIAKRCLAKKKQERFASVADLIVEVESYIEGRPEWMPMAQLKIERKEDWEFQENVFLAKHIAITRSVEVMEWVNLMISRASFPGNIKCQAKVCLKAEGNGIGFLFSIPEASERKGIEDGYCLWIGSVRAPSCKLFRSNVEVLQTPAVFLKKGVWHLLRIEKVDNHVRVFLDDLPVLHYISHSPLLGTHVGLLFRDHDFEMEEFKIFTGSQNVMVNCLAVPDAFLANRNFSKALVEYRRIGYSFSGRQEGREALFRAGVTLLEQAKEEKQKKRQQYLYQLALDEFSTLRSTPGAPLEYLGKALVYNACNDLEEENKCLELASRKYAKHPLLHLLSEHIVFRLHEASFRDRIAAYHFALLALRHIPKVFSHSGNTDLLKSLENNLESLDFLLPPDETDAEEKNTHLAIQLAFWLAKPMALVEIIQSCPSSRLISNALFCLIKLGCIDWAQEHLHFLQKEQKEKALFEKALLLYSSSPKTALNAFFREIPHPSTPSEWRCLRILCDASLEKGATKDLLAHLSDFRRFGAAQQLIVESSSMYLIWALLLESNWKGAMDVCDTLPPELFLDESSPFYFLMGILLWHNEGKKIALSHFSSAAESLNKETTTLLARYLNGKIDLQHPQLLFWEKIQLYRQLHLFYTATKKTDKVQKIKNLLIKTRKSIQKRYGNI